MKNTEGPKGTPISPTDAVKAFLFMKEFNAFVADIGKTLNEGALRKSENLLTHISKHGVECPSWLAEAELEWFPEAKEDKYNQSESSEALRLFFCIRMRICGNPAGERVCVNVSQCYTCRGDGDCTPLLPNITVSS